MSEYRDSPAMVERMAVLQEEIETLRATAKDAEALREEVARLKKELARPVRGIDLVAVVVAAALAAGILVGYMLAHR